MNNCFCEIGLKTKDGLRWIGRDFLSRVSLSLKILLIRDDAWDAYYQSQIIEEDAKKRPERKIGDNKLSRVRRTQDPGGILLPPPP